MEDKIDRVLSPPAKRVAPKGVGFDCSIFRKVLFILGVPVHGNVSDINYIINVKYRVMVIIWVRFIWGLSMGIECLYRTK